jgi:hypothetical protein
MDLRPLTDAELLSRLNALAAQERESVADVVEHLAELERRDRVADTGFATLFDYCTKRLRYSEGGAFARIRAARASLMSPRVIDDLRSGAVSLEAVRSLAAVMTPENGGRLLDLASGATSRQVQSLVTALSPAAAPEREVIRVVAAAAPAAGAQVIPEPSRVRLTFTADGAILKALDELRNLRRHAHPEGRLEDLLPEAIRLSIRAFTPRSKRLGSAPKPDKRRRSRRIPAAVKAQVWERDGGRCVFIGPEGTRCESTSFIQFDHIVPWSQGGPSTPANLRLLCRPHNLRLARRCFGGKVPERGGGVLKTTPPHAQAGTSAIGSPTASAQPNRHESVTDPQAAPPL